MKKFLLILLLSIFTYINVKSQTLIHNQVGITSTTIPFGSGVNTGTIKSTSANQSGNTTTCAINANKNARVTTTNKLTIELTGGSDIYNVVCYISNNSSGTGIVTFKYEYSVDGIIWTNLGTKTANGYDKACQQLITSVAPNGTKFCRIMLTGSGTGRIYTTSIYKKDCPTTTTWNGTVDNNWLTPGNWSNGVPCSTTDVIIPTTSVNYPAITTVVSCKNIIFESNAGVLGLYRLSYEKAFVRLTLKRNRYYCLTAPLKQTYSGDYFFSGSPEVYIKFFNIINPDLNTNIVGSFGSSIKNQVTALTQDTSFAFNVSYKTWNYPNGYYNDNNDITITFPRLNLDSSLLTTYIPYSIANGKPYLWNSKTVMKDSYLAYRFISEDDNNILVNKIQTIPSGLTLVGNPIMSHLDINQFLTSNSTVIDDNIKLWDGSIYQTYDASTGIWDGSYSGSFIAPLQSFIVSSSGGGNITFDITNHYGIPDNGSTLRGARIKPNVLKVLATNGDGVTSGTVIVKDSESDNLNDDKDIIKLFSSIDSVADIYSVTGSSNIALSFNKFKEYPFTTPLGIRTTKTGNIVLEFNGTESFDGVDVILVNTASGEQINLKETTKYTYGYDSSKPKVGELFISFRNATIDTKITTNNKVNWLDSISIINKEELVNIKTSYNNPITDVFVYDTSGRLTQEINDINSIDCKITLINRGIHIIKLCTKNVCVVKKIFIK